MSTGLVRDAARRSTATRAVRAIAALASLTALAAMSACANGALFGPGDASLVTNRDGVAVGPSGLQHRLVTRVEAPEPGSPFVAHLWVTSTIVNTGATPVRLTYRSCDFIDADVETTAQMSRFGTLRLCATINPTIDLAPGAFTEPEEVGFGVRSGPGTYTITLRQALSPEFRAQASFRIP